MIRKKLHNTRLHTVTFDENSAIHLRKKRNRDKILDKTAFIYTVHFKDPRFKVRSKINFGRQNLMWRNLMRAPNIFRRMQLDPKQIFHSHLTRPFCRR
ncbi:hypothetical protein CEXT_108911 [Caerostris extrusa]|uniref:Uncharacterized protein n=1 Tax=Caerostris extrusa TaxID=172846 RepID=A0AAV4WGL9_CAEEX|nr:hypothetical protein CEXT_108911 [Caerostris extrusa]